MKMKSLLQDWQLREEMLSCGPDMAPLICAKTTDWMHVASLPCDVHTALVDAGKIEEPLIGRNTFDCEWVEQRSWWFRKTFFLSKEELTPFGAELFLEILDIHADLFLNDCWIDHHASAMFPFRKDVSPWLHVGENTLLIRLTTGLEHVDDKDLAPVRDFVACEWRSRRPGRGDERRVMLRKPQYVFGWDQSPRLATCAIAGDVRLELLDEVVVRDIRFETKALTEAGAEILAEAEIESRERLFARECTATFSLEYNGQVVHTETKDYLSQTGLNFLDFSFTLKNPELWWPHGHGDQPLYTVRVTARNHNHAQDEKTITTGIRTVELDMTPLNENERRYGFRVNGKLIYCKGMDFIHSDCLYARVTNAHIEKLLTAARDADFNMLRFWDGNRYENDYVYELCNRYGILVHQGFAFACGAYPDHLPEFRTLVEQEAAYQLRRLRNHPCIALWCGNGENNGLLANFLNRHFFDKAHAAIHPGGSEIYGYILPRMHHTYVATVGYQCCSPFGGFEKQETAERGDRHYYPFLNLNPANQQFRISVESFDPLDCKFLTEGGVMGPPSPEVLAGYLGGEEHFSEESPVFEHHRNTFERWAVRDGIYKHYTGKRKLSMEEYCLYGGLFQGTMLAYEADHVRLIDNCGGCVLWCFDDGFGEVGFSLMDHLGNPKPAYYFLRRAYHPNRIVLRRKGDVVRICCGNDGPNARTIHLTYGYVAFDGTGKTTANLTVDLPANRKSVQVAELPLDGLDLTRGVFYVQPKETDILPVILRSGDFRTLLLPRAAELTVSNSERQGDTLSFTVTTDVFAHAVHFRTGANARFSDQYFDLLPGESRRVTMYNAAEIEVMDLKPQSVYLKTT